MKLVSYRLAGQVRIGAVVGEDVVHLNAMLGAGEQVPDNMVNFLEGGDDAIDAADNSTCSATDQRGFHRPVFGGTALRCDIGAFELYRVSVRLPLVVR